jgi:methyl-accepting chemotaxis protein
MLGIDSRRWLLLLALVPALAAAGCGGGSSGSDETQSTSDWADGLCSAITSWKDSVADATKEVTGGDISKDSLENAANDIGDANQTLADDLNGLGRPDTESGQKVEDSVQQLSDDVDSSEDKIKDAVDSADDVSSVIAAVSTVTSTLGTLASQVGSALTNLAKLDPRGEIQDAFSQADSCDSLRK